MKKITLTKIIGGEMPEMIIALDNSGQYLFFNITDERPINRSPYIDTFLRFLGYYEEVKEQDEEMLHLLQSRLDKYGYRNMYEETEDEK